MTAARSIVLVVLCALCGAVGATRPPDPILSDSSDPAHGLDLTQVDLVPLYRVDFSRPLALLEETELFEKERRVREPTPGIDWVLDGKGTARTEEGRLLLSNEQDDVVLWNTRKFPADFLLEFGVFPHDPNKGLNIVFLAAMGRDGGGIFDLAQPRRAGAFKAYHSGALNSYHVSYWATDEHGAARGTAHIRKNYGLHLVAQGSDFITGQGKGPHVVRVLKIGGNIQVEVDGKIAVRWTDDGSAFGPILEEGFIGLRQMAHTQSCRYTHFHVWAAKQKAS